MRLLASTVALAGPPPMAKASRAPAKPVNPRPSSAKPTVPSAASLRTANDAVYLEGGGPAVAYSIDYDRRFLDVAVRIGVAYWYSSTEAVPSVSIPASSKTYFAVPLTFSYLGVGSQSHMLELGAGIVLWGKRYWYDSAPTDPAQSNLHTQFVPLGLVGYRYQPPDGGFAFRTGLTVLVPGGYPYPIIPWPYLALGWAID